MENEKPMLIPVAQVLDQIPDDDIRDQARELARLILEWSAEGDRRLIDLLQGVGWAIRLSAIAGAPEGVEGLLASEEAKELAILTGTFAVMDPHEVLFSVGTAFCSVAYATQHPEVLASPSPVPLNLN